MKCFNIRLLLIPQKKTRKKNKNQFKKFAPDRYYPEFSSLPADLVVPNMESTPTLQNRHFRPWNKKQLLVNKQQNEKKPVSKQTKTKVCLQNKTRNNCTTCFVNNRQNKSLFTKQRFIYVKQNTYLTAKPTVAGLCALAVAEVNP